MENLIVRPALLKDVDEILIVEEEAWPEGLRATREQFISRIEIFPEGTIVAVADGHIIGVVSTEIVSYNIEKPIATWDEATDRGFIKKTHNPKGDTLYGVDLSIARFVDNASRLLMEAVGKLVIRLNLKQGVLGARIPRYYKLKDRITIEEYINGRRGNRPMDPELAFYKKLGLKIGRVLPNYINDLESCNYGVLLVWKNPFYGKPFSKLWSWIFRT